MPEHEHEDQGPTGKQADRGPGARSGEEDGEREATVDRVVSDVKDGVDRVAEKVKDLLRSKR